LPKKSSKKKVKFRKRNPYISKKTSSLLEKRILGKEGGPSTSKNPEELISKKNKESKRRRKLKSL